VVLHAVEGERTVEVEDLSPRSAAATEDCAGLLGLDAAPAESVGYSRAYDLGEAVRDALSSTPPQNPGIPDWLSTYEVVSIGVQRGGIAGFDHLVVRVRS